MLNKVKMIFLVFICLSVILSCSSSSSGGAAEEITETVGLGSNNKISACDSFFWGKWVRMDTGETIEIGENKIECSLSGSYEINVESSSENQIVAKNFGSFEKQSDSVLIFSEQNATESSISVPYFRKGGANLSYSMRLVGLTKIRAEGRAINLGVQGVSGRNVSARSKTYSSYESNDVSKSEDNGKTATVSLKAPTAGDKMEVNVKIDNADGFTEIIKVPEVVIENNGDNMGTIAIVDDTQFNLKVTGTIPKSEKYEDVYLFGRDYKTYPMTLTVTNISKNVCRDTFFSISADNPGLKLSNLAIVRPDGTKSPLLSLNDNLMSAINPDATLVLSLDVSFGDMTEDYINAGINVLIEEGKTGAVWEDYIPLRFYRGIMPISVAAKSNMGNSHASLNGFLIYPDGNNQFFSIGDSASQVLMVPVFGADRNYTMVFSGASSAHNVADATTMFYTVVHGGRSPLPVETVTGVRDFMSFGEGNDTETTAFDVSDYSSFEAYIGTDDIDYYTIPSSSRNIYDPSGSQICFVDYETEYGTKPAQRTINVNQLLNVSYLPELTCEGRYFCGWYDGEGENAVRVLSGKYTVADNVKLYAKWSTTSVTVELDDESDLNVEYELSQGILTFVAEKDFSSYKWYVDGEIQQASNRVFLLSAAELKDRVYTVGAFASDGAKVSSATLIIKPSDLIEIDAEQSIFTPKYTIAASYDVSEPTEALISIHFDSGIFGNAVLYRNDRAICTLTENQQYYRDSFLAANTVYSYEIKSSDNSISNTLQLETPPAIYRLKCSKKSYNSITLTVDKFFGSLSDNVYLFRDNQLLGAIIPSMISYEDKTVSVNKKYSYQLFYDAEGNNPLSDEISIMTEDTPFYSLTTSNVGQTSVTVNYNLTSGSAVKTELWYGTSSAGLTYKTSFSSASGNYSVTGLKVKTTYYFQLKDSDGNVLSSIKSVTTLNGSVPGAVSNLSGSVYTATSGTLSYSTLSWRAATDATSYRVYTYRSTSSSVSASTIMSNGVYETTTSTSYYDSRFAGTYLNSYYVYYLVVPVNEFGIGTASSVMYAHK